MEQKPKRGLGKGLETLLASSLDKGLVFGDEERIQKIAIDNILPNPQQPRKHFDTLALDDLAKSICSYGILLPLVATQFKDGKYYLVAGERRLRAAKLAGLKQVPVIVRSLKDLEQLEISLIENVQRVDLNPLEQALSLARLHEQFSVDYQTIAKRLGKAPSTINNMVRLLKLPEDAQQALREQNISEGHGRAILALKDSEQQQALLLKLIIEEGWSVRQAEQFVINQKKSNTKKISQKITLPTETLATKSLSSRLKAPVMIKRTSRGGRLEIIFRNDDELDKILSRF